MFAGEICFSFEYPSAPLRQTNIQHFRSCRCGAIFNAPEHCERQACICGIVIIIMGKAPPFITQIEHLRDVMRAAKEQNPLTLKCSVSYTAHSLPARLFHRCVCNEMPTTNTSNAQLVFALATSLISIGTHNPLFQTP